MATASTIVKEQNNFVRVLDERLCRHVVATIINDKIHVFVGSKRKYIFCCPTSPKTLELHKDQNDQWLIWIATNGGHVYRKSLNFSFPDGTACNNHDTELMEIGDGNNHSIFDDLLHQVEPDFEDFIQLSQHKSQEDVCKICEEDRMLACDWEITSIFSNNEFLVLSCQSQQETAFHFYSMTASHLPESQSCVQKLSLPFCEFYKEMKSVHQLSKCVVTAESNQCNSSSKLNIPSCLFSLLFGWETSVRRLPVLLCSMDDGSLYFHPVDLTVSSPELPSWKLLCAIDSPVVDFFTIKLKRKLSENESMAVGLNESLGLSAQAPSVSLLDALIVIGASGKCGLLTAMPALGSVSYSADYYRMVMMFTLAGNVSCVCNRNHNLFIANEQGIQKFSLTLIREEGKERKYSVEVSTEHISNMLVSSMWFSEEEDKLLCVTANGDFVEFECSVTKTGSTSSNSPFQPPLKDLLLGLDVSQCRINKLKRKQDQLNEFLQQINVASHLLHASYQYSVGNMNSMPVSNNITVQSYVSYQAVEYSMVIEVTNNSTVTLTKDWSLMIMFHHIHERPKDCKTPIPLLQESEHLLSHTFSFTQELEAGCQIGFRLPLAYSSTCCGLEINSALMLHIPEFLQQESQNFEALRDCLIVPLSASEIDVFHFLHLKQAGFVLPKCPDPLPLTIQVIGELRFGKTLCEVDKKSTGPVHSTSEIISVSQENLECATGTGVLRRVVRDSQVDVDLLTNPCCTLQAPCGSLLTISIEVLPQPFTSIASNGQEKAYEVVMKSSDISLLARARLAINKILQNIGRKTRDWTIGEFQNMICKTEVLQQRLQGIQEKVASENAMSAADTFAEICAVYEMMHTNIV